MRCGFCQPGSKYDSSLRNGRYPFRNDEPHQTTSWKNSPTCVAPADALTKAGCEKLFSDKASGAKADRPGLAEALRFARAGDCIVVWKLDRLGRSIQGLIALAAELAARKVDFRSLTDGFDTSTASGRLLFHILASVAEMERELVKERTIAGLAAARKQGGTGSGRKSALTPEKLDTARKLLAAGDKPAKVAKLLQVGLSTFYRHFPASERELA